MRGLALAAFEDSAIERDFDDLERGISNPESDRNLDPAGLSGTQLAFKLAVVERRREELAAEEKRGPDPEERADPGQGHIPPGRGSRWGRRLRRQLVKLLDAIDVILESLMSALQGAGEIIKELKQTLETWLED